MQRQSVVNLTRAISLGVLAIDIVFVMYLDLWSGYDKKVIAPAYALIGATALLYAFLWNNKLIKDAKDRIVATLSVVSAVAFTYSAFAWIDSVTTDADFVAFVILPAFGLILMVVAGLLDPNVEDSENGSSGIEPQ